MTMKPFDLIESPLDGVNLIEASAGTGKTYTIAGLYLRLVLEKAMSVEKILVVTFTEAATQELKDRIRKRLKEAEMCFEKGSSQDPLLSACLRRSQSPGDDLERLRNAVRSFDQAAVFTIHGFCQRMLIENAFESGSLFETELVTDTSGLVLEIIKDYLRTHVYGMTGLFADYLDLRKTGPESLAAFIRKVLKPGLRFVTTPALMETGEQEREWERLYQDLRNLWTAERKSIWDLLGQSPQLNQRSYSPQVVSSWARGLDRYFSEDRPGFVLPEKFGKGYRSSVESGTKKNMTPPDHPFFRLCEDYGIAHQHLMELFELNEIHFKQKAMTYVEEQLEKKKQEKGILFFDDLLTRLCRKLSGDSTGLLAARIRSSYGAALIDEFQDTDPVQYAIFSRVFAHGGSPLFMIGDPKQAIYGFRGADIFAYLKAAGNAESAYTLGKNYRSDPKLVEAVNILFENAVDPFVFPEITFQPASADESNSKDELVVEEGEDCNDAPMRFIIMPSGDKEKDKKDANPLSRQLVAGEMARLLDLGRKGRARLGGRPVEPRDMAVLVRTNVEARAMHEELNRLEIPSVIHDTGNVFQSHEAMELSRVLAAVAHPGRAGLVKAALATDMMGVKAVDLECSEKDGAFEIWCDMFRLWNRTWTGKGFAPMFHALVKEREVKARLMALGDGHRRNTNLAHLAQLLHQADLGGKGGPAALMTWLREQMGNPVENEEHQLRLEQDDEAVTIVTIHKSKGMEYPIVFLPFLWNHTAYEDKELCVFHGSDDGGLSCDMGSEQMEVHKALAMRENLAESLRVLYVALTRAKKRCVVVWGRVKNSHEAALARLVYNTLGPGGKPADDREMTGFLKNLEERSNGRIRVVPATVEQPRPLVKPVSENKAQVVSLWNGRIENDFRIASFSSLTSRKGQGGETDARDRDREKPREDEGDSQKDAAGIMAFPKGAKPGTFLHEIFEQMDFTWKEGDVNGLVARKLEAYGYEPFWKETVTTLVMDVLNTPLDGKDSSFTLSSIPTWDRLNELEFYFPLARIRPESLSGVFAHHGSVKDGGHSGERFEFQPVKGFMKGFMDLVFRRKTNGVDRYFIVDWKSNFLGYDREDYHPANLARVMVEERYDLQYHLYVLALDRYLSLKLGELYDYRTHFGGVFYVFLRGVKPEDHGDYGIFRDTPGPGLIKDLSRLFWGG
jgi:exodeoxyribonuclease V beta subunit